MKRQQIPRRGFLSSTAAVVAVPTLVSGKALGLDGNVAANDRIIVGAVGCGVRGYSAINFALQASQCQIVAVCDVRRPRLVRAQEQCNAHYGRAGQKGTYKGCQAYHEYRDLLARDDIDAVILTPPDHWHGVMYSDAIRAGKDMYAEKPVTRTIAEGQALRKLVKQYGVIFQTGTHSRSHAWIRHACELVRNGYLGKIHTIEVSVMCGREYPTIASSDPPKGFDYDRWTGPAPYVPFDTKRCEWLAMYLISHYCAGFIANWGVHFMDIAQWGCPEVTSKPFWIEGKGEFPASGMTDSCNHWDTWLTYDSGLKVHFTDETKQPNGCRFIGDEGWVKVNWKKPGFHASDPSLRNVQLRPGELRLHATPAASYFGHTLDLFNSMRTRQEPAAPFEAGHRATTIGNVADICVRLGRKLRWDWETETFNDPQANA
ncbi:MAG: Gfo/Idh/MocA family oxidoreductase, partial [Planctomycetota bacterium]|nr:Gfo/Idh/MocA family oxidoreductase [Planctomycetota bacterium]